MYNLRPGFMSSVYPKETLSELIETARKYGYQGIEFRTEWNHSNGVELESSSKQRKEIRRRLSDNNIIASCIATSVKFRSEDPSERKKQRQILKKYVVLAAEIGALNIRTFGDLPSLPENDPQKLQEILKYEAESYALVDEWAKTHGVKVLVETHGNFRGDYAQSLIELRRTASLGVLWHIGHHIHYGQSVDEAYQCIGGYVRHLHFSIVEEFVKDADNLRTMELLAADNFDGFFSVEVINPKDPDTVLANHIAKFNELLNSVN